MHHDAGNNTTHHRCSRLNTNWTLWSYYGPWIRYTPRNVRNRENHPPLSPPAPLLNYNYYRPKQLWCPPVPPHRHTHKGHRVSRASVHLRVIPRNFKHLIPYLFFFFLSFFFFFFTDGFINTVLLTICREMQLRWWWVRRVIARTQI
jgi:hypothetical protein